MNKIVLSLIAGAAFLSVNTLAIAKTTEAAKAANTTEAAKTAETAPAANTTEAAKTAETASK